MTALAAPPLFDQRSTEAAIVAMLRKRYGTTGPTGLPQWVCAAGLRDSATFATGACDFVAMGTSAYKKNPLHGHEIKVSRSDWLRELKQPEKAEVFKPFMDFWWLVISDVKIARVDELPPGWGLLAPSTNRRGLAVVHPAPKLDAQPMPKQMIACYLRRAVQQARQW